MFSTPFVFWTLYHLKRWFLWFWEQLFFCASSYCNNISLDWEKKYTTSIGSALANDINAGIVGLILAFIVVSMYQVNQHAQKAILKETAILVSILNTSEALDNADEIREAVHRYTKAVIQEEWPLMRSGNSNQIWNQVR